MALCTAPNFQEFLSIVPDAKNGAIVAWIDARNSPAAAIYARRVSVTGLALWTPDGVPITAAPGSKGTPTMVPDGAGGAVLAWADGRNFAVTGIDIYTQQVGAGGGLGVSGGPLPGTPLGPGFAARIREAFVYPPDHAGSSEGPVSVGLPQPVEPGFLVLLDDSTSAVPDSTEWSDIVYFPPFDPAAGSRALFFSDPPERPFTDADLAPFGLTVAGIRAGNTGYVRERLPFVTYEATDPATGVSARYAVYSDVDTIPPGAPLAGAGVQVDIAEPPDESGEVVSVPLPLPVQPGFLVLLESASGRVEDPANWSDVLYFTASAAGGPGQAILISDQPGPGGVEQGITLADLSPFGLTVLDVLEGNTMYVPETQPTGYDATNPGGGTMTYMITSDVNETGVTPRTGAASLAIRAVVPNPTTGATRVEFEIPQAGRACLEVYDVAGARIRTLFDGPTGAGTHSVVWDGRGADGRTVAAGVYFARLSASGRAVSRRILMAR